MPKLLWFRIKVKKIMFLLLNKPNLNNICLLGYKFLLKYKIGNVFKTCSVKIYFIREIIDWAFFEETSVRLKELFDEVK